MDEIAEFHLRRGEKIKPGPTQQVTPDGVATPDDRLIQARSNELAERHVAEAPLP